MTFFERVIEMLGFHPKPKSEQQSYVGPDVSKAVQRNEQSATRVRRALEDMKMADTLRDIAGKM